MLKNKLFFENVNYNPKSLYKQELITVQVNTSIILAGVILILFLFCIAVGSIENYNYLIAGI